jgi:hypothetical protein
MKKEDAVVCGASGLMKRAVSAQYKQWNSGI